MNIQLNEKYQAITDKLNYILQEKKVSDPDHPFSKGDGQEKWVNLGYFGKWTSLVRYLIDHKILGSEADSLQAVTAVIEKAEQSIVEGLNQYAKIYNG